MYHFLTWGQGGSPFGILELCFVEYLNICNNIKTILNTIKAAKGRRMHLAHVQFYGYDNKGKNGFSSGAYQLCEAVNKNKNIIKYENHDGVMPKIFKGEITLKDLSLGFNSNRSILFQRLNCTLPSGSTTVISGHNSSGKTSLCNSLIFGL